MNKLLLALLTILLIGGCASTGGAGASASDNGGLPDIAAVDDIAIDPLADMVSSEFDGMTTEVSDVANDVVIDSDNGGLPEIAAVDDEAYDVLPDVVSAQ